MRRQSSDGNTGRKARSDRSDKQMEFHTENSEDTRSAAEEEIAAPREAHSVFPWPSVRSSAFSV